MYIYIYICIYSPICIIVCCIFVLYRLSLCLPNNTDINITMIIPAMIIIHNNSDTINTTSGNSNSYDNDNSKHTHSNTSNTPSPPTKSLDFGGFESSRLSILRGGNSHVRMIL